MDIREIHELAKITYNSIGEKYHALFKNEMEEKPFDREYLDRFAESLPAGALICDAGCGPSAQIGRYLFEKGFSVFGIDISEVCISIARQYNPAMNFICTDYLNWQQEPSSLDAIISFYSIIYTPKEMADRVLGIFREKLKSGGKLLTVVKKGSFEGYQDNVLGINVHSYFTEYTERDLELCILKSGFTIDEMIVRAPYEGEINNERIYCIATKP